MTASQLPSKSERTRARILQAAARVLSERGYAGARLRDIAEEAGMKTGSLYYHFDSKDDLVEEVLRHGVRTTFAHVTASVDSLPASATPAERVRSAIRAHAESVVEISDFAAAHLRVVGQVPAAMRRRLARDERAVGEYWHRLLDDARRSGDIRADLDLVLVRLLLLGAVNWVVEWPSALRRPGNAVASTLSAMVFDGLAPPAGTAAAPSRRSS